MLMTEECALPPSFPLLRWWLCIVIAFVPSSSRLPYGLVLWPDWWCVVSSIAPRGGRNLKNRRGEPLLGARAGRCLRWNKTNLDIEIATMAPDAAASSVPYPAPDGPYAVADS